MEIGVLRPAHDRIIGRERELGELDAALDVASPWAAAAVLLGPAGAGKTTLLLAAVGRATDLGLRVLLARPSPAEARLSYSALSDVLAGLGDEPWAGLPAPQRRAFDVAFLRAGSHGERAEPRAIALGLSAMLRAASAGAPPLVLAIDDAQWLDRPSAFALAYALRRLADAPIRLVACVRTTDGQAPPDILHAIAAWPSRQIEVGPLSVGAIFELLRLRAGIRLPRPLLVRVHAASGGNPFFALEIGRAIAAGDRAPGEPLPLPHSLDEVTRERLGRLSPGARAMLLAVSAMTHPTPEAVLAACDDPAEAARALEEAATAGILELSDRRVRFSHPLLASAAEAMASPAARRRVHRRLADIVDDEEARARHLALSGTGPSVRIAASLDRGAERARARGAPDAAAELAERALDATPPGRAGDRRDRRIRAARLHFEAGDPERAMQLLEAGLPSRGGEAEPEDVAELLVALAEVEVSANGITAAVGRYRQALEATRREGLRSRIHADLASALADAFDLGAAREQAVMAVAAAEAAKDRAMLVRALTVAAYVATITGAAEADDLLARAVALESPAEAALEPRSARFVAALRALYDDRVDEAREGLESLAREAEAAGAPTSQTFLAYLSLVERRAGRFDRALHLADAAHEIALQTGRDTTVPLALHLRAQALAHLGDADGARATAALVAQAAAATGQQYRLGLVDQGMLGFLSLSLGDPEGAARLLDPAADELASRDPGEPSLFTFLPDAIEAAVELGRLERAEVLLARMAEPAERLGRGWALMASARCRALIDAARGDDVAAAAAFAAALEIHDRLPSARPFELGRVMLGLGSLQRRRREKARARETLGIARGLFLETGARLWVRRAEREAARIGGRRAVSDGLSEVETRIANQVVSGRTNKEIAAALGISAKTVAWNLSKVYAKLGVASRTELAGRLRAGGSPSIPDT